MAALQPLEVHDGEAAATAHLDGELRIDDGVEGGGEDGMIELVVAYTEANVGEVRVYGDAAGDDRDFVKAVGGPEFLHPNR